MSLFILRWRQQLWSLFVASFKSQSSVHVSKDTVTETFADDRQMNVRLFRLVVLIITERHAHLCRNDLWYLTKHRGHVTVRISVSVIWDLFLFASFYSFPFFCALQLRMEASCDVLGANAGVSMLLSFRKCVSCRDSTFEWNRPCLHLIKLIIALWIWFKTCSNIWYKM